MTDPLDSSRPSAFNRLASARIKGAESQRNSAQRQEIKVFREVGNAEKRAIPPHGLNRLEDAVSNNSQSRQALTHIAEEGDVSAVNAASSHASVRDVDKAHSLAEDLRRRILKNQDRARDAQDNLAPETVKNLLR